MESAVGAAREFCVAAIALPNANHQSLDFWLHAVRTFIGCLLTDFDICKFLADLSSVSRTKALDCFLVLSYHR